MHKELEAQAVASGKLLPGPLRPYAATVDLADVQLDAATGMPLDLKAVAQAVAKEQAAAAKAGRRRGKQKSADVSIKHMGSVCLVINKVCVCKSWLCIQALR